MIDLIKREESLSHQTGSISGASSEIAILVENVAGQPVSRNLGQPKRASTPPCWVSLNYPGFSAPVKTRPNACYMR